MKFKIPSPHQVLKTRTKSAECEAMEYISDTVYPVLLEYKGESYLEVDQNTSLDKHTEKIIASMLKDAGWEARAMSENKWQLYPVGKGNVCPWYFPIALILLIAEMLFSIFMTTASTGSIVFFMIFVITLACVIAPLTAPK